MAAIWIKSWLQPGRGKNLLMLLKCDAKERVSDTTHGVLAKNFLPILLKNGQKLLTERDKIERQVEEKVEADSKCLIRELITNPIRLLSLQVTDHLKAILAPTHELVDMINDRMLSLISGDEKKYNSSDTVGVADVDTNFNETMYIEEFLNNLNMAGIPHHSLPLCACETLTKGPDYVTELGFKY
ncbi:ATP-dependent DNA helicase PIF1-like protein [Tanacetum coccineum]